MNDISNIDDYRNRISYSDSSHLTVRGDAKIKHLKMFTISCAYCGKTTIAVDGVFDLTGVPVEAHGLLVGMIHNASGRLKGAANHEDCMPQPKTQKLPAAPKSLCSIDGESKPSFWRSIIRWFTRRRLR